MGNESPKSIGRFIIPAIAIGLIINAKTGTMNLIIDNQDFKKRKVNLRAKIDNSHGFGRELFKTFRKHVTTCEEGAISIG